MPDIPPLIITINRQEPQHTVTAFDLKKKKIACLKLL